MLTPSPYSAAQPTSRLAAPPVPLNSATISGIDVMATSRAARAPMIGAGDHRHGDPVPLEDALRESSVTTTAISMPAAEIALPRRAVAGEPSIFRPNTKRIAATM